MAKVKNTVKDVIPAKTEITLFGKKYPVSFSLRNLAAMQEKFVLTPEEIVNLYTVGNIKGIAMCIWGATLIFDEFDPADPLKIKEEIPLEKIYTLNVMDGELVNAITSALSASNHTENTDNSKNAQSQASK